MGHVYYHHPGDKQFSIDFVHQRPAQIVSKLVSYDDNVAAKVSEYSLDEDFYVVYTSREGGHPVKEIDFEFTGPLQEMESDNRTIITRLLEMYRSIISRNGSEEGVPVEAYKGIDIEELPAVLDETSWTGSATEIAGRLASNLILKHALPNANHRTAIALIQFYLRRIDSDFSLPNTKVEIDPETYDWRDWVNEYINESKRLLTVRRKNVVLKYLREFGATELERKHNVVIYLDEYKLDMYPHDAMVYYAEQHEDLWIDFVEEAVERAGNPGLKSTAGLRKSEFADAIRKLT